MTVRNLSDFSSRGLYNKNIKNIEQKQINFGQLSLNNPAGDSYSLSDFSWNKKKAELLKKAGNEFIKINNPQKAINLYQKAINDNPEYSDAYYNLAKTFKNVGDYDKAIINYEKYLKIDPIDAEVLTNLGECYKEKKQYVKAEKTLKRAVSIDPKLDFAARQLKEIQYLKQHEVDPASADLNRSAYAAENMRKSLVLLQKFYPPEITNQLEDITFCFDETDSLGGHQNIAQYEIANRRIVVTNKYVYAAPEVITAYLVHEVIHSLDRDALTSIQEEQEAYRKSVEFWSAYSNGVKDPEMDYAKSLYDISPEELDKKVAEIYATRDGSIPLTSPHHGLAAVEFSEKRNPITNFFSSISANIKNFFMDLFAKKPEVAPASLDTGLYSAARR